MRKLGCVLGILLLLAAAAIGLAELSGQGAPVRLSFGAMWYRVHANSLVGFQALIENGLSRALWPPIQFLLTIPTWWLLLPPGLVLVLACQNRARS